MGEYFKQYDISFPLVLCCLGVLFILSGIRSIRTEKAVVVSRDSHFRWKKPGILKGKDAIKSGKGDIIFGAILFLIGLIPIIGTLL